MKPDAFVERLRGTGGDFETFGALTSGTRGCVFNERSADTAQHVLRFDEQPIKLVYLPVGRNHR